jgi:hypothetical protein
MSAPALNWNDVAACAAWLAEVQRQAEDVASVAEDQTAPPGERRLGRALAGEMLAEATESLEELFAYARAGPGGGSATDSRTAGG